MPHAVGNQLSPARCSESGVRCRTSPLDGREFGRRSISDDLRAELRFGAISVRGLQDMGFMRNTSAVRNHFMTSEAKKKLLRPCREARVLGL
jgi:hypothetical protein